jgi:hypothetical protein
MMGMGSCTTAMNTDLHLKEMSREEIPEALERAERYREFGESAQAESVCHDVLLADPQNQRAHVLLLESLCDRFGKGYRVDFVQALEILPQIEDAYERAFYAGVICDHKAHALLTDPDNLCRYDAYEYLTEAMSCYEKAEKLRPAGCSEARQRWNACARIIAANGLEPWPVGDGDGGD